MNIILRPIYRLFVNWQKPTYSPFLFKLASKYVDFCYGDNNFDRTVNGEERVLKLLMNNAEVVFDIGANIGDYSADILAINDKTKIHAFEPDVRAFSKLSSRGIYKTNNVAMGEKEGTIQFYAHNDKTVLNSVLDLSDSGNDRTVKTVQMSTVDAYSKKYSINHIDFLKIDVEGYEFSVIKGSENMLSRGAIDAIQFEFSGATSYAKVFLKDFIDLFNKYGYTLYRVKPLCVERIVYRPDQERFTLTNYIAIKNDKGDLGLNAVAPGFLS